MNIKQPFPMSTWCSALVLCVCSQTAAAQTANHPSIRFSFAPRTVDTADATERTLSHYFAGVQAAFSEAYPVVGANADGTDLWPCVGGSSQNPDCPTLGNPQITLPANAIVTGFPAYGFALRNTPAVGNGVGCDALVNGTGALGSPYKPCGQIGVWYDDNSNDPTDDLLWHIVVTQGSTVVYASGTLDYGPASQFSVTYPVHVVLLNDANLGYWPGAEVGPNNGNCSADAYYPLAKPAFPGGYYSISANRVCGRPQPGLAKVTSTISLATPHYTQVSGNACTGKGVQSPCYVVAWTPQREIHQSFMIELK